MRFLESGFNLEEKFVEKKDINIYLTKLDILIRSIKHFLRRKSPEYELKINVAYQTYLREIRPILEPIRDDSHEVIMKYMDKIEYLYERYLNEVPKIF